MITALCIIAGIVCIAMGVHFLVKDMTNSDHQGPGDDLGKWGSVGLFTLIVGCALMFLGGGNYMDQKWKNDLTKEIPKSEIVAAGERYFDAQVQIRDGKVLSIKLK